MERPLAAPLLSVILGISVAGMYSFYVPASLLAPLLAVTFLSLFLRSRVPFVCALSCILFAGANLSLQPFVAPRLPSNHVARFVADEPVIVEGIIDSRPEATQRGGKVYLRAERIFRDREVASVTGRVLLFIGEGRTDWLTGDRVRFASRLQKPRNYGLPGEFDYERYLAYQSVYAAAFVKTPADLILIRAGVACRVQRAIDAIAVRIGRFIDASVPATEGAILRALLIGDMGYVPRGIKDAYSRTGVNHILSISGFHVGVISLFIFQILMCAARTSEFLLLHLNLRRFILLLTLPVITFYLFLSGAAPATVRSVVMIGFYILALVLEREADPVNSLMLAALFILAFSPPALFDISFQLSFLALWGLLVLTPLFMAPFKRITEGLPRKLLLFLMASAAATVATIFPVAYYFHRVSATGLISNFFIVPLMGYGAVVLGFSALPLVGIAPVLARPLLLGAALLVKLSNVIITILAKIPTLPFFNPDRLDLLLSYLVLSALTFIKSSKGRLACCTALALLGAGSLVLPPREDAGKLTITVFSVGQGESTLITFPDGKRMLVDGGGSAREGGPDVGERLLAPALWRMGVTSIDYMVLSHPHPDHLQGLKYVAATFRVGEFWEGPGRSAAQDYADLHRILFERQVPLRRVDAASPAVLVGGVRIEPLGPIFSPSGGDRGMQPEDADLNDESLVFRLAYREVSMLFTGDIGADAEERLLRSPERLKCTILKVPHHGSRYSSSPPFLDAAAPEIAVISAGYRNSFHLPAGETLDSLTRRRIAVYRTDLDGTIQAVTDGSRLNLRIKKGAGHFH
ncbi:MAG TPA: DNA internalization-related competence protein ComEC/Rec2 [Geobacteraceae bacterium]